jgi:CHAD domain-containing protein
MFDKADAPMQLAARFSAILQAQAREYVALLRKTRRNPTRPQVHALRIATRRLLTALALTQSVTPAAQRHGIEQALQETFEACGRVRDLQLAQLAVAAPSNAIPELGDLAGYVRCRLRKRRRRLVHALQRAHPRRLEQVLLTMAAAIAHQAAESERAPEVRKALSRNLRRSLRCRAGGRVDRASPDSLHRRRRALRAYRNRLALANQLGARVSARHIAKVAGQQSALGVVNDYNTLLRIVDHYARRRPSSAAIGRYRLRIQRQRNRAVERLCCRELRGCRPVGRHRLGQAPPVITRPKTRPSSPLPRLPRAMSAMP